MPRRESRESAQTPNSKWWIPLIIGLMMMVIPGGVFVSPIFFILSIIMKRRKPKSPETSPSLLFQFTP